MQTESASQGSPMSRSQEPGAVSRALPDTSRASEGVHGDRPEFYLAKSDARPHRGTRRSSYESAGALHAGSTLQRGIEIASGARFQRAIPASNHAAGVRARIVRRSKSSQRSSAAKTGAWAPVA